MSGEATPDHFELGENDRPLHTSIVGEAAVLSDEELALIAGQARRAEVREGHPLDLEWAIDTSGELFWLQAYGPSESFLAGIADADARTFAEINYGPWDRLAGDEPFLDGVGPKPAGARFYPQDMTDAEFDAKKTDLLARL